MLPSAPGVELVAGWVKLVAVATRDKSRVQVDFTK